MVCMGALNAGGAETTSEEARRIFRESLERGAALLRGSRRGDADFLRARGQIVQARDHHAQSWEARYWLALWEVAQGDGREDAHIESAVDLARGRHPEAYLLRGQARLAREHWQDAFDDFDRARELLDQMPASRQASAWWRRLDMLTRFNLGRLHFHQTAGPNADAASRARDLATATAHFEAAAAYLREMTPLHAELASTWVDGVMYQGWCAYGRGEYMAAEAFFLEATAMADASPAQPWSADKGADAVYWRGLAALGAGRPRDTLTYFADAARRINAAYGGPPDRRERYHPSEMELYLQLGSLCFRPEINRPREGLAYLDLFVKYTAVHPRRQAVARFVKERREAAGGGR